MFTWNFQYISKARLAEAFQQLLLDSAKGDILIRIHTAIHGGDEAVDLARFIKTQVPSAHIFGTSTSAVIVGGKLIQNQCVVSVTQVSGGYIRKALLPTFDDNNKPIPPITLTQNIKTAIIDKETRLLLTFLTGKYLDVYSFIEKCNDIIPGVQMTGGLANTTDISLRQFTANGFLFDENGWTDKGIILAAIGGAEVESYSSYATGVQTIGDELEVTDTFGTCILTIDGMDAAEMFRKSIGDEIADNPELANMFPYVYADTTNIPVFVSYSDNRSISEVFDEDAPMNESKYQKHPYLDKNKKREMINANHNIRIGKKLKRAFIYDRKIVEDNKELFGNITSFSKAETIFAYSCIARSIMYSNCVKWELSAYENSNMCGCITEGEIVNVNGRNTFSNCSFVLTVIGEEPSAQQFNPYAFSYTDVLEDDNKPLLDYLCDSEAKMADADADTFSEQRRSFVYNCELKLLYSDVNNIPNAASMNIDLKLKGYDRICMINVFELNSMETVFTKDLIDLTYRNYLDNCMTFAHTYGYTLYLVKGWNVAVGSSSAEVPLEKFVADMKKLQKVLFDSNEEFIAIVPMFCVIDDCTPDNVYSTYYSARVEMTQKNIQFYVRSTTSGQLDEESIRERYHMVNVINYAIAHDKVIPYFQGIYDNKTKSIHHYESLMRLEDEAGTVYTPGRFLDVARSYGLFYDSISKIMITKVFEKFRNIPDKSVSINLSIRDIRNRDIIDYIYEFLSTAKHPENFVFEILENEDINDYNELITFVDKIHDLGAQISIDDFGSGFSNLQHIASIHSDYLKIDGSIIKRCCDDEESANIVALVAGWKKLSSRKMHIVAEFVENGAIQDVLLSYGIDFSQGYLFSKPSPIIQGL